MKSYTRPDARYRIVKKSNRDNYRYRYPHRYYVQKKVFRFWFNLGWAYSKELALQDLGDRLNNPECEVVFEC